MSIVHGVLNLIGRIPRENRSFLSWGMRVFGFLACALLFAIPAYAQTVTPGIYTSVTAELSPAHPEPDQLVRITLKSSIIDLSFESTTWRVDDEIVQQGYDVPSIEGRTGELGTKKTVTAEMESEIAEAKTAVTLAPTERDILWERDSFTPPFYRGRARSSAGASIRLQAIPRFKTSVTGAEIAASTLVYTWKRNGAPILSVSGVGKSRVSFPAPGLFGSDTIEVEARTPDGALSSARSIRISSIEPLLTLYKVHPLYGIMFYEALGRQAEVPDEELSFAAIPFFADASSAHDEGLVYSWTVNDKPITADPEQANIITIDASGSTGMADIDLTLSHAANLFLRAVGAWSVTFTNVLETIDPFRPLE